MMIDSRVKRVARIGAIAALSFALASAGAPTAAFADTEDELASAQARLSQIGAEYQALQQELQQATTSLEETASQIEETTVKLNDAQQLLADNISGDYKTGGVQLLQVLLGATDFNDFVSRIFYLNKVNDAQAEAIQDVKDLQAQLEQQQAEQQQALSDTQAKLDAAAANQQSAQELVNSLSAEVRAELEAAAQEDEQLASGMQSASDAENNSLENVTVDDGASNTVVDTPAQDDQGGGTVVEVPTTPETPSTPSTPETPSTPSGSNDSNTGSSGSSGSGSSSGSSTTGAAKYASPIAYALEMEGQPYVYGGESLAEGGFDCSGLVYYAYQCIGVTVPRGSTSQMNALRNGGGKWTTSISELEYGDLVFYPGHVAFYVGNGMVFGAQTYGSPAGYGQLSWYGTFLGGGRF